MQLYYPPEDRDAVRAWADQFELVASSERPRNCRSFYLWWDHGRLVLYRGEDARGVSPQPAEFERRASLRGELARACGVTAQHKPRILDAMAGLGLDGMTLNALGCPVLMIERHPALWAVLASFVDLLDRGDCEVVHADSWEWLHSRPPATLAVDVVYLDPMFPERRKGALPGKSMQFIAELTDADPHPLEAWIRLGKRHARERVVLKRRLRDPLVSDPDWQIKGRSVRYDVYRSADSSVA